MSITRRGLLAGILGACAAPAIIHNPMRLWVPSRPSEGYAWWNDALIAQKWQEAYLASSPPFTVGIDEGWPGGDHTAMVEWHADRLGVVSIRHFDIWPVRA